MIGRISLVGRYFVLLASIVWLGGASFVKSNGTVFEKNNEFHHVFLRNLKNEPVETGFNGDKWDLQYQMNDKRKYPDPKASNMNELKWSDELAIMAADWGKNCPNRNDFGPKDCERLITQYIFISDRTNEIYLTRWWDSEGDDYDIESNKCRDICKHYKMMVRAEYYYFGCARKKCRSNSNDYTYVCNFHPSIEDRDSRPYKVGNPCSECPKNSTCDSDGRICVLTDPQLPIDELSKCSGISLSSVLIATASSKMDNETTTTTSFGSKHLSSAILIFFLIQLIIMLLN